MGTALAIRVITWLVARFGVAVLEWKVQQLLDQLMTEGTAPSADDEPYVWDEPFFGEPECRPFE